MSRSGNITRAKKYTSSRKVALDLQTLIAQMRCHGESFLPSERKLSTELHCSRVVLRKVLAEFEERGELLKGAKGRIIAAEPSFMRVVFATNGDEAIHCYSWNHLWSVLEPLARAAGIEIELVLHSPAAPLSFDRLGDKLPDAMLFTSILQDEELQLLIELKEQIPVIALDSHYRDSFDFAVTLDDYDVGYRAGQILKQRGYQQPAFIADRTMGYLPFEQRRAGFCDAWVHKVMVLETSGTTRVALIKAIVDAVKKLLAAGADALFLYSDEAIDFVYQAIAEERSIPAQFGLITLNGSGRALAHAPQVTAFSHMIPEIAQQLNGLLTRMGSGSVVPPTKIKVAAENIFTGATVNSADVR